jgi:hypothetical protein
MMLLYLLLEGATWYRLVLVLREGSGFDDVSFFLGSSRQYCKSGVNSSTVLQWILWDVDTARQSNV